MEKESGGPENVLFGLLDWQARAGLDQVNLLILLCLVNLSVILGLVHRHLGGEGWAVPVQPGPPAGLPAPGGGSLDGLLQMAGGLLKDVDPALLLGLMGPLLGGLGGPKGPGATGP